MRSEYRVLLFGTFHLETPAGEPVHFARRKSAAVVAFLALHAGMHTREKLASLFWGDADDEDARRSLRVTLADIRKAVGVDLISGDRNVLGLNPQIPLRIDALDFEQVLSHAREAEPAEVQAVIELYRSDLLEGFYYDWAVNRREFYRELLLRGLHSLAERYRAASDYPRVIAIANRLLQLEPADELAHQHIMVACAAQGDRYAALNQYELCRNALQELLGVAPSVETQNLLQQIKQQQTTPAAARLSNLPTPLTSFIGREAELNTVETYLAKTRLLTLLGAGGSGKTRLAIQAADEVAHDFPHGVWWVDLTAVGKPDLVAQAIAAALGVRESRNQSSIEAASSSIGEGKMLLLLDNCEHVLAGCRFAAQTLLAQCPALVILATSREPLNLVGEIGWSVPTLPLPNPRETDWRKLRQNEAIQLFGDRAQAANSSFQLSGQNIAAIAEICRRLDGIPLAIELSAAQIRSHTIEQIATNLHERFRTLVSSDSGHLPRQRTLKALLDWSYNLLNPAEQALFCRLGVFSGGWDAEMAATVAGGYIAAQIHTPLAGDGALPPLPITPLAIIANLLDNLQRRSLIAISHETSGTRYRMLETLREYALEQLAAHHELAIVQERHLHEFTRLLQLGYHNLKNSIDQLAWLNRISAEFDNLRAALSYALGQQPAQGIALAAAIRPFWNMRGSAFEALRWIERFALHPATQTPSVARALLLVEFGLIMRTTTDPANAEPFLEEAKQIYRDHGDNTGLLYAMVCHGDICIHGGTMARAKTILHEALALAALHPGDHRTTVTMLSGLARVYLSYKDFANAQIYVQQSLERERSINDLNGIGWSELLLGDIACNQDDLGQACVHYEESLRVYRNLGRTGNVAYLLEALGCIAFHRGQLDLAQQYLDEAIACYEQIDAWSTFCRAYRGAVEQARQNMAGARQWLARCIQPLSDVEDKYQALYLVRLGAFVAACGDTRAAAQVYRSALDLAQEPVTVLFPPDLAAAQQGWAAYPEVTGLDFAAAVRVGAAFL